MSVPGKLIALLFLGIGVFVLTQVSLPLLTYHLWEITQIPKQVALISPQTDTKEVLGISIETTNNFPAFISNTKRETQAPYEEFNISVPSINITDEPVFVDSNNLSKGLVHLPASALPGEKGNIFISGHSSLPQFSTSKKAIFANLQKMKKGDDIFVFAQGAKYNYKVVSIKVVDPKDLSVIAPPDTSGRYITLMTCVPPGLNTKRLVVLGKL